MGVAVALCVIGLGCVFYTQKKSNGIKMEEVKELSVNEKSGGKEIEVDLELPSNDNHHETSPKSDISQDDKLKHEDKGPSEFIGLVSGSDRRKNVVVENLKKNRLI
ncbi:hypothetical protein RFI_17778 [Reticulomyxa filosa]|uniref:Uncharacterized protein n=1 Tax=Reticulomyxa filosa TaxID=46433 RepID=X6N2B9_RETFI|nr:hypothetical protein RFI_17778 [Reticulomyxa filosa]|eukprot:ETO19452.1 hypothetical protein RFI_17778 [Reticulomyxa filosa]